MRRHLSLLIGSLVLGLAVLIAPSASWAYPFWAQQNYDSPREATGKIVCANCHLAQKLTQAEVPQAVLPDSVFKASVKGPYQNDLKEIGADGSEVPFSWSGGDAPTASPLHHRIAGPMRSKRKPKEFSSANTAMTNPISASGSNPGDQHQEIVFPVLSPDPNKDNNIHFGKYQIHVGGNRGRGQVYPPVRNRTTLSSLLLQVEPSAPLRMVRMARASSQSIPTTVKPPPKQFPLAQHCWSKQGTASKQELR